MSLTEFVSECGAKDAFGNNKYTIISISKVDSHRGRKWSVYLKENDYFTAQEIRRFSMVLPDFVKPNSKEITLYQMN